MGQFVQNGGEHFPSHGAVGAMGLLRRGAAVDKAVEQVAIEVQLRHQRGLAVGVGRHLVGPADIDASVQPLDEARRQRLHGFIEQRLAGLLLRRAQSFDVEVQLQAGLGHAAREQQDPGRQPGGESPHNARMASARTWSLASRASGTRVRKVSKAASR